MGLEERGGAIMSSQPVDEDDMRELELYVENTAWTKPLRGSPVT
jgi:hypothetical protein